MSLITFPLNTKRTPALMGWNVLTESVPHVEGDAYGVLTGAVAGIFVVDLDMKNGKDGCATLEALGDVPETLTVKTKSGGFHLYFLHPGWDVPTTAGKIGPGVDIRGEKNGYVVGPGSPGYEIIVDVNPVEAPEWLLEAVRRTAVAAPAEATGVIPIDQDHPDYQRRLDLARTYLQADAPPAVEGHDGSTVALTTASHLTVRLQIPVDVAYGLMLQHYNPRCQPSWNAKDLYRKVAEAAKNSRGLIQGIPSEDFSLGRRAPELKLIEGDAERRLPGAHIYSYQLGIDESPYDKKTKIDFQKIVNTLTKCEEWAGVWQHNVFRDEILAVRPPLQLAAERELRDTDFDRVRCWFNHFGFAPTQDDVFKAVVLAAERLPFHPVQDYLRSLPEVPADYLTGFAARVFGCDTEMEDVAVKMTLVSAVRRVFEPGCFQKGSLILYGEQNAGKSRFCRQLFGKDWFKDGISDLRRVDAKQELRGVWGCELGELASTRKADVEVVKQFLSGDVDNYRPSYGKVSRNYPRQCVFIGTTNEREFLNDPSGATRYWPVEVKKTIDFSWQRDHVWSAAYQLYLTGFQSWMTKEQEDQYAPIRAQHAEVSAWQETVMRVLLGKDKVTVDEVLARIIPEVGQRKTFDRKHVMGILRQLCGTAKPSHGKMYYMVPEALKVDKMAQN